MIRILSALPLVALIMVGCTTAQIQKSGAVASTALSLAQTACQGASFAKGIALSTAKGGALGTVNNVVSIVDATCQADALINAVAKDPATGAFINGLGAALIAASSPPAN